MLPRNAQLWAPGLIAAQRRRAREHRDPGLATEIFFCIADHFEPARGQAPMTTQRARVAAWAEGLPRLAAQFRDIDGRPPQHTFFYPEEEYHPEHLQQLARLGEAGLGEVEVHLHHDADSADGLREKLELFKNRLVGHGLHCRDRQDGRVKYAFIHGDWALDNSRRDRRMCGVNNEITILKETGCYADFTLPSAPSDTQTTTVNSIYRATGNSQFPKSHDRGIAVEVGRQPSGDLLLIQGPLAVDWWSRKWGLLPRLENGAVHAGNPPTARRFQMWVDAAVGVRRQPHWVFVKIYTHGAVEENAAILLGDAMQQFHSEISRRFNDGQRYRLHYVTAREMANLVFAAEAGEKGDPNQFRDYRLVRESGSACR